LKPGLAAAAKEIPSKLIQAEEDILSYCLFPEVALGYFKWRAQPDDAKDPIPADVEMQKAETAESAAGASVSPDDAKFVAIGKAFAALMATMGGGKVDLSAVKVGEAALSPLQAEGSEKSVASPKNEVPVGTPVLAPLNGTFYRSAGPGKPEMAKDGDAVKAGDAVCIVEAMKLFNPIKATASGTITFLAKHGAAVTKGETLAVISA
jgi:biotin carboxyl carrier protein